MQASVLVTCEHAGNEVPPDFGHLFNGTDAVIHSHRGWDPGAFQIAEFLAEGFNSPLYASHVTRLLIETNRSLDSLQLFSEFSKTLSENDKSNLIDHLYKPYREAVESEIAMLGKPVLHLSIHSFTPELNGVVREVDIGLLFDPERMLESKACELWKRNLKKSLPEMNVRFNEPYRGVDDGFTTYLRTRFADHDYAGIEVEVNQKHVNSNNFDRIQSSLLQCFPL